jgi:exosortase family protein XrtF
MKDFTFREFRPTIFFIGKFVGIYLVGSLLYGLYITSYEPTVDPVTRVVSEHAAAVLTALGHPAAAYDQPDQPTTSLVYQGRAVVSVYEGCNGINVLIIFLGFLIAFGPVQRAMIWFIPAAVITIHLANLARIALLFWVALYRPHYLYYTHKYFFTAAIYAIVFCWWVLWIAKFTQRRSHEPEA